MTFDWLTEEIAMIKTNKFHLVDGPASPAFREVVETSELIDPLSYKAFVLQFGNANLYRRLSPYNDYYLIKVYAGPREAIVGEGAEYLLIGKTPDTLVYVDGVSLDSAGESPVYEWAYGCGVRKRAAGFMEWLEMKCKWARKQFKKSEWQSILQGPFPFTPRELDVVNARRCITWKVMGFSADEDLLFEIKNGSDMRLPYLTLGFRGKQRPPHSGELEGLLRLPVWQIFPGQCKVVSYNCYKKYVSPEHAIPFDLPDPYPEDRLRYWEFNENESLPPLIVGKTRGG